MTSTPREAGSRARRVEMETLLHPARRRVHKAAMGAQLFVGFDRGLLAMIVVSAAYCVIALGCRVVGRHMPLLTLAYAIAFALVPLLVMGVTWFIAYRRRPSLREAAERLDLGVRSHNRVAIALALDECASPTPFASAAIADGMAHLRKISHEPPRVENAPWNWRRTLSRMALVAALTLLSGVVSSGVGRRSHPAPAVAVVEPPVLERRGSTPSQDKPPRVAEGTSPQSRPAATVARPGSQSRPAIPPGAGVRAARAAGRAGGRTNSDAVPSVQMASATGESSEAASSAADREKREAKGTPPARPKEPKTPAVAPKPEQAEESSSIGQGSSGGGAMSTVRHNWSQREQASELNRDEDDSDEPTEDERESSVQRGGIQPSLKDRNESPSRELGISGEEGPPGAGRGGPTPPKKSRGTASLVLGVPVPDFVKGRLGPGLTKITHDRVEPTPMPGEPGRPVDVVRRSLPEAPCVRYDVPSSLADVVRDYLVARHSADQKKAGNGGATETSPGASAKE
mgnify:CR=1 FL=1